MKLRTLAVSIVTAVAMLVTAPAALAHSPENYFDPYSNITGFEGLELWDRDSGDQILVHFTSNIPNGKRTAIQRAMYTWNAAVDAPVFVVGEDTSNTSYQPGDCSIGVPGNRIIWGAQVANTAARTHNCVSESFTEDNVDIDEFQIAFDTSPWNWYSGTGDPDGTDIWEQDLESVAVHELGHVLGFYGPFQHFKTVEEGGQCDFPALEPQYSMCAVVNENTETLDVHDIHTVNQAYNTEE